MRTIATLAFATTIGLTLAGAAHAESRSFELKDFDKIDIATGIDAIVTIGDTFAVVADSNSPDALDNLRLTVSGGVLSAHFDQSFLDFIVSGGLVGMLLANGNAISVNITLPAITGISASSGADVRAGNLSAENLEIEASSGSDIRLVSATLGAVEVDASSGSSVDLSGTCDSIDAGASSGSSIDADGLVCATATAQASSGADIDVHATQSLKADASSGGNIEVRGNPAQTDIDSSSGGDVSLED